MFGRIPAVGGLNYVANGEIGVGIGRVIPKTKRPKRALALNVEFSSQPGFQYSYWPTSGEDVDLELAWAVTVHKSQGSEFDTTFLVLPALMHVSANGIPMASKNEVIIAGVLDRLVPGLWEYERPFTGSDGREVLPDFTIVTPGGRTLFWEHAGMLDLPTTRKWGLKKAWYAENGVLSHSDGGGTNGTLMWTDDLNGADAQAWLALASEVLGVAVQPDRGRVEGAGAVRRVAKRSRPAPLVDHGRLAILLGSRTSRLAGRRL